MCSLPNVNPSAIGAGLAAGIADSVIATGPAERYLADGSSLSKQDAIAFLEDAAPIIETGLRDSSTRAARIFSASPAALLAAPQGSGEIPPSSGGAGAPPSNSGSGGNGRGYRKRNPVTGDLVRMLGSEDVSERRKAAKALGDSSHRTRSAIKALLSVFDDEDEYVRRFASRSLPALAPLDADIMSTLEVFLQDDSKSLRYSAHRALMGLDSLAVPTLSRAIERGNRLGRYMAVMTLFYMGPLTDTDEAIPALITALQDERPKTRGKAYEALEEYGPAIVPGLVDVLKGENVAAIGLAAGLLAYVGAHSRILRVAPLLIDVFMRFGIVDNVARAISQHTGKEIGAVYEEYAPRIVKANPELMYQVVSELLKSSDISYEKAIKVIGRFGKIEIDTLLKLLHAGSQEVDVFAADRIAGLKDVSEEDMERIVTQLLKSVKSDNPNIARASASALAWQAHNLEKYEMQGRVYAALGRAYKNSGVYKAIEWAMTEVGEPRMIDITRED